MRVLVSESAMSHHTKDWQLLMYRITLRLHRKQQAHFFAIQSPVSHHNDIKTKTMPFLPTPPYPSTASIIIALSPGKYLPSNETHRSCLVSYKESDKSCRCIMPTPAQ